MPMFAGTAAGVGGAIGTASYTTAMLATDIALISAGMGAYGQYQTGKFQERMTEYNAQLAAQEAETIKEASEYEQRAARKEGRKLKDRQFVQFAKGGVVPTTGTPLLVRQETAEDIEKDIRMMQYGYGIRRGRALSESKLQKMKGKGMSRAARWTAGTSLLTGAYRVSSIYA